MQAVCAVGQLAGGVPNIAKALLDIPQRRLDHVPAVFAQFAVQLACQALGKRISHAASEIIGPFRHIKFQQPVLAAVAVHRPAAKFWGNGQRKISVTAPHGFLRVGLGAVHLEVKRRVIPELLHDVFAEVNFFVVARGALI